MTDWEPKIEGRNTVRGLAGGGLLSLLFICVASAYSDDSLEYIGKSVIAATAPVLVGGIGGFLIDVLVATGKKQS